MINVTKTFLPPQHEYHAILKKAWETGWLTNRGVLVKELEEVLMAYLQIPNIICMTNGTLPLQIAIKGLGLKGEIITTPFSYVATTSSIVWEGCKPIFVDIHPEYLTIDETKIEAAITKDTSAILATHVFGNPCNIDVIDAIASKYNLKVIYDAAHCFGINYKGKSIFEYGDVSTCSFHATKLFHTGEGGSLSCKPELYDRLFYYHNFGHDGPEDFHGLGINAKMSEPQAAMGLSVLSHMPKILKDRQRILETYKTHLSSLGTIKIRRLTSWNYSYYPLLLNSEQELKQLIKVLKNEQIFPRRYFYPSLNTLPYIDYQEMPMSESIAKRIMCLPLYFGLGENNILRICKLIRNVV